MSALTILVVEDEPDYQLAVSTVLKDAGFPVCIAGSAEEALPIIRKEKPALVLLDINLPGMDGYAFCRLLRQQEGLTDLPILMLTVRRRPNEWQNGFTVGATDYLPKPFNPPDLVERIQKCLGPRPASRLPADDPEHPIIEAALTGNRPAFELLIQQYKKPLSNVLMAQGVIGVDAEEFVSETLARAYTELKNFRGESSFQTWLTGIALNTMRARWRRASAVPLHTMTEEDEWMATQARDREAESSEPSPVLDVARLKMALERVPAPYRKPLELFYLNDLSYDRISQRMNVPVGTVMSRLHRARTYLRKAWDDVSVPPSAA